MLILSGIRMVLCCFGGPVRDNVAVEGSEIELPFSGGTKEAVPVCFV